MIVFEKPNVSTQVFEDILKYIYNGTFNLDYDMPHIFEMLSLANDFILLDLIDFIQDRLLEQPAKLKVDFSSTYEFSMKHEFKKLREFCLKTIQNFDFTPEEFRHLNENLLESLLKRDDLYVEEFIWNNVLMWGVSKTSLQVNDINSWTDENFTEIRNILSPLIKHIRFTHINTTYFYKKIVPIKKIFDRDYYENIIEYSLIPSELKSESPLYITPRRRIDSLIINNDHKNKILSWINESDNVRYIEFSLLIRGTRDGLKAKDFYGKCDNKGPTIVLFEVKNSDFIIGGYNPLSWRSPQRWVCVRTYEKTNDSFIFRFDKNCLDNHIISKVIKPDNAVCNYIGYGPTFGGHLENKNNIYERDLGLDFIDNKLSCEVKKYAYNLKLLPDDSVEISEYEVFQLVREIQSNPI